MTGVLYGEWIKQWDDELQCEGWKILLLQDNCTGHIVPDGLTDIYIENFLANLTPHIQPMDAASSNASRLTIVHGTSNAPLIVMIAALHHLKSTISINSKACGLVKQLGMKLIHQPFTIVGSKLVFFLIQPFLPMAPLCCHAQVCFYIKLESKPLSIHFNKLCPYMHSVIYALHSSYAYLWSSMPTFLYHPMLFYAPKFF